MSDETLLWYRKPATTWLEALPIGIVVFPGSGISENLADKARAKGIPVQRGIRDGA